MPYSIRKLPGKNKYRVKQLNSGKIVAKGTVQESGSKGTVQESGRPITFFHHKHLY